MRSNVRSARWRCASKGVIHSVIPFDPETCARFKGRSASGRTGGTLGGCDGADGTATAVRAWSGGAGVGAGRAAAGYWSGSRLVTGGRGSRRGSGSGSRPRSRQGPACSRSRGHLGRESARASWDVQSVFPPVTSVGCTVTGAVARLTFAPCTTGRVLLRRDGTGAAGTTRAIDCAAGLGAGSAGTTASGHDVRAQRAIRGADRLCPRRRRLRRPATCAGIGHGAEDGNGPEPACGSGASSAVDATVS